MRIGDSAQTSVLSRDSPPTYMRVSNQRLVKLIVKNVGFLRLWWKWARWTEVGGLAAHLTKAINHKLPMRLDPLGLLKRRISVTKRLLRGSENRCVALQHVLS
jgi:hypothetical protein